MRKGPALTCGLSLVLVLSVTCAAGYKKRSSEVDQAADNEGPFVLHTSGMSSINPEIKGLSGYQPEMPQKKEWPELVGQDATEAKEQLEKETSFDVFLVPTGSVVTMDFRTNRIRVSFDPTTNKVVKAPRVG